MVLRKIFLAMIMVMMTLSSGFCQSLEDVIENAKPDEQTIVAPVPETVDNKAVAEGFADSLMVSPMGMPSIERLLAFIRIILHEIVVGISEVDMNEPGQPSAAGAGSAGAGATAGQGIDTGDQDLPVSPVDPEIPGTKADSPVASIPISGAGAGSAFMKRTESMNPAQREQAIIDEILAGNIPSFLKEFKEVEVSRKLKDGKIHTIKYQVMPDYLAIGNDSDFVRMPMSPLAAQVIAEKFGCILPTTQMVDDIYKKAQTQLLPQPMSGGKYKNWQSRMTKNEFYVEHQRLVQEQVARRGHQNGMLVAGHKKDVVISNHLNARPKNVVIYGWHDARNGGKPIQGYGWSHENTYADYSHGIRLVNTECEVDGKKMSIKDVLADKVLCELLSKEGPVKNTSASR